MITGLVDGVFQAVDLLVQFLQLLGQLVQPGLDLLHPVGVALGLCLPELCPEIPALLLQVKTLPEQLAPLLPGVLQALIHLIHLSGQIVKFLVHFVGIHMETPFCLSSSVRAAFRALTAT